MAAKKKTARKVSADTVEARGRTQLKQVGKFYSGKGSGSADAQAGRGAARRSDTYQAVGKEGPKKPRKPNASEGPKKPKGRAKTTAEMHSERTESIRTARMYKERVPASKKKPAFHKSNSKFGKRGPRKP